ncbi:flagella basal body P-ring formation protein FlgA [Aliiruegeria haliotis]|uniref:Flagella basal body P-ring formation protein FlgA n=1 Tax=Aliiruegeria haliotis TaxID=1280846 RepID=A0A2T0RT99_9RHOB|nr:flagellar basal body P-ring formation chaperone FlgA [Aliiruegeria haliotis]PRY24391.1 flagella basal body P-ring formation protein FlgA [Aliiruegeria haliotis]
MNAYASLLIVAAGLASAPLADAETLIANRTIRSRTVIDAADLIVTQTETPGALERIEDAAGMEAKVVLYAGRPVRADDLQRPAVIERNQIVSLVYHGAGLSIATDGRSLARAAMGDLVRVMNLSSRTTVTGTVDAPGRVVVKNTP